MAALASLQQLWLAGYSSFGVLTSLGALTFLDLSRTAHLPACLSQLTQLRSLAVQESEVLAFADEGAALTDALPHLRQLTQLQVVCYDSLLSTTNLAALTNLRALFWFQLYDTGDDEPPLPAGPWLAGLQQLHCDASLLAGSGLAALSAAQQLQQLLLVITRQPQLAGVLSWAAGSPSLTRLVLGVEASMPVARYARILDAQRLFPQLRIDIFDSNDYDDCEAMYTVSPEVDPDAGDDSADEEEWEP